MCGHERSGEPGLLERLRGASPPAPAGRAPRRPPEREAAPRHPSPAPPSPPAPTARRAPRSGALLAALTTATFLSALLLFLLEPLLAKMVLPLFGGAPAVWTTCMLFFQAALLAGYAWAHLITTRLRETGELLAHGGLLLLALAALPLSVAEPGATGALSHPALGLLALLARSAALPFLALAATTPLIQRWLARTGVPAGKDPYFLYAASNAGSLIALLGYPLLVEPFLALAAQCRWWSWGFLVLFALVACSAITLRRLRSGAPPATASRAATAQGRRSRGPISWRRRLGWLALAWIPSSLMLGTTTYLSNEIAPVPLLWVVPLALYLSTFVLAFARRQIVPWRLVARMQPALLLAAVVLIAMGATQPMWLLVLLHLGAFTVAALACHGALGRDRPAPESATEFYLWLAAGGALGGLSNALLAPLLFRSVLEYPLALACAAAIGAGGRSRPGGRRNGIINNFILRDLSVAAGLGVLFALGLATLGALAEAPGPTGRMLLYAPAALIVYLTSRRPLRYGAALAALSIAATTAGASASPRVHAERSFFGVHAVYRLAARGANGYELRHGSTVHGRQLHDGALRREPLLYYHRSGPAGQIMAAATAAGLRGEIGVVGLGSGALAAYAKPGERWTFYEIDRAVVRIARDLGYFTYLADSPAEIDIVLGDARQSLARGTRRHGVLVIDAFSSDTIPMHLLTAEAIRVYLARLAMEGLLVFHISNRHLELEPVLRDLAAAEGLCAAARAERFLDPGELAAGKAPSHWVVMTRDRARLAALTAVPGWRRLPPCPGGRAWTDASANILEVLRWR